MLKPWTGDLAFDAYNWTPAGLSHDLHELDLFSMEQLKLLSKLYHGKPDDYFVAGNVPKPGVDFYAVPCSSRDRHGVLSVLDEEPCRILLKRPETMINVSGLFSMIFSPRSSPFNPT